LESRKRAEKQKFGKQKAEITRQKLKAEIRKGKAEITRSKAEIWKAESRNRTALQPKSRNLKSKRLVLL